MRLQSVQIRGLRCIDDTVVEVAPQGVWLLGPNGAGKTSVLEALCLLGFGRSFRGRVSDGLIQRGQTAVEVVATWQDAAERRHVSGLRHEGSQWEARLDGMGVASLSQLAAPFPVLCFHPDSATVVVGPAEERRRTLDWLAFHVEPRFAEWARRFNRALKQRNALLRSSAPNGEFVPWEREMSAMATSMTSARSAAIEVWAPALDAVWPHLVGNAARRPMLTLRPGWRSDDAVLEDLLLLSRDRDRELGYTTVGPQRADLALGSPFDVDSAQLSRGQAKVVALALMLAQAEALCAQSGERTLLLLDDLQAELDLERQTAVLQWVERAGYQAVITGTRIDAAHRDRTAGWAVFHVEHGRVLPAAPLAQ